MSSFKPTASDDLGPEGLGRPGRASDEDDVEGRRAVK